MTTSHRDLALLDPWTRSLERSLHRRAIAPAVRRSLARRRRTSIALSTLMVAGPTGSLLAAAGFGLGGRGVDVAQASPANRAIDTGPTPDAMAFELGDRGAAIAEIQRQLGLDDDGIFGPLTHASVTDFQARNGLEVDGIVGPVTWTALFGLAQAAAAAGAGDGSVAVILRERGAEQPAVGGGDAPDDVSAPGTDGDGSAPSPDSDPAPAPTKPVSAPAPTGDACGSLRLASPVDGTVTSGYGPRWGRNHDGLDIAAPSGTPIRAAECGVVSFAGVQSGYGNMVCVQHSSRFETCYAHMTQDAVSQGQRVERGQVIGYVGCTGNCTGPHLHFETRVDGVARDPRPYLAGAGVPGEPTVKAATKAQLTASIRKDVVQARTTAKTTLSQQRATTALAPTATSQQPVATTGAPVGAVAPAPAAVAPVQETPTAPVAAPVETTPAPVAQEPAYVPPVEEPAYTAPAPAPTPAEPVYEAPAPTPAPEPVPAPTVETPPAAAAPIGEPAPAPIEEVAPVEVDPPATAAPVAEAPVTPVEEAVPPATP